MAESKHTPIPWLIDGSNSNEFIVSADGGRVASCCVNGRYWREAEANAEFIVRAVNSHAALVAACEAARNRPMSRELDAQLLAALKLAKGA